MLAVKITLIIALLLSIVVPFAAYASGEKTRGRYKKALALNVIAFFGILVISQIVLFTGDALAAEETANAASSSGLATGLGYLAAALVTGLSCIGGGIAVASAASALGAISEDQSILGKSLIFVGLAEGVALYGLIISFMILSKL